jgi:hypothetical protein
VPASAPAAPALPAPLVVAPPPAGELLAPGQPAPVPHLRQLEARRNRIIDEEDWFTRTGLSRPGSDPAGDTPATLAGIARAFSVASPRAVHLYETDGTEASLLLVAAASGGAPVLLDLRHFLRPPAGSEPELTRLRSRWMWADDELLYVAHAHSTYASASGGENARLSAIELATGRLRWRSRPLRANAATFVIWGDYLVCGYGFTREPDHLYVLDRRTGSELVRHPLRSGPEYILRQGEVLHVRTYDHDYRFALQVPGVDASAP